MKQPYIVTLNDGTRIQVYAANWWDAEKLAFPFTSKQIESILPGRI